MDQLYQEFVAFIQVLEKRMFDLGFTLLDYPIDHVCYRVADLESFKKYCRLFASNSLLYTKKFFHERDFMLFVLKKPFVYQDLKIPFLEFSQPGGSDNYQQGFQHVEIYSPLPIIKLFPNKEKIKDFLFEGKHGDETYLKWPDKLVVKVTDRPIFQKALLEDDPEIVLNSNH